MSDLTNSNEDPRLPGSALPLSRRDAVRLGLLVGGGLIVACKTPGSGGSQVADATTAVSLPLVSWIQITADNQVKYVMPWTESGQGIGTGLAMLVGEELDVDPAQIIVVYAGGNNLLPDTTDYQPGATGGSASMSSSWAPLRQAAAATRAMLIAAAAADWGVAAGECTTQTKQVLHQASGKVATFGSLAAKAAALPVPASPTLKAAADYKYIGKPTTRIDLRPKVDGTAVFGIDIKVDGMVNATIVHCPYIGGKLGTLNDTAAKAQPGVTDVVQTPYGVAVVADTFWHALNGSKQLVITWDKGPHPTLSSDTILTEQKALVEQPALVATSDGDFAGTIASAAKKVEAYYQAPYLPHVTLEPQNCTATVRDDGTCEVWAPTQDPVSARDVAAGITGFDKSKVKVNVTLAGGAFGRRLRQDYVGEAVFISKAVKKPVKLLWARPEDFAQDFYRPASYTKMQGGLDASGNPVAILYRSAGSSILGWLAEVPVIKPDVQTKADDTCVEGAAQLLYTVPNLRVEWAQHEPGVPVSWWRSVGYSHNTWIIESFLDELAHAAGKDPLAYRLALLKDPKVKAVLQAACDKAGWATPPPAGTGRGLAVAQCFGSTVAEVVEVTVQGGAVTVTKVTAAVDVGTVVNPFLVQTQVQSAIIQALSATLKQEITVKDGQIQQRNFNSCSPLTCGETPDIQIVLVPGGGDPGGIGEPGVPPLAPAVCNAIFAVTGQRIRKLPVALG